MSNEIAIIVDTNSNYSDVWPPCFGRLERYAKDFKKYVFTDNSTDIPSNFSPIVYNNSESYRNQFLSCIKQVEEKYVLYTSEDYILYDYVSAEEIVNIMQILDRTEYSFCKFIKGPEHTIKYSEGENLYVIDQNSRNLFAQQASIWKTRDFQRVFEESHPSNGRMQHEPQGSDLCRKLNIRGLQHYSGTPKRGVHHHDSSIYPCIATAVVKGQWNISEYLEEMNLISEEYKINFNIRGAR